MDPNRKMNFVFILSNVNIASASGAAYNRYIKYAKALTMKNETQVLFCSFGESYIFHKQPVMLDNNIYVISDTVVKPEKKYYRLIIKLFSVFIFWNYFKLLRYYIENTNGKTYFYLVPGIFSMNLVSYLYIKVILKKKLYSEKNELKTAMFINLIASGNTILILFSFIFFPLLILPHILNDILVCFSNGVIVISIRMENFVHVINKKTIRVPVLCDIKEYCFINTRAGDQTFKIGFTGTINNKKEGIFDFIHAIQPLANKYQLIIDLYGPISSIDNYKLERIKRYSAIEINYYGNINSALIPTQLINYDLLVLPRPSNLQTNFGFSTKLAEYLASRVPVFVSDVSDNKLFIKNGIDGFIFENSKENSIYLGLKYILENRSILKKIGDNGRIVAENYFDYRLYTDQIFNFITQDI